MLMTYNIVQGNSIGKHLSSLTITSEFEMIQVFQLFAVTGEFSPLVELLCLTTETKMYPNDLLLNAQLL